MKKSVKKYLTAALAAVVICTTIPLPGIGQTKEVKAEDVSGDFGIDEKGVLIAYMGESDDVVIPSNVTSIADYAFIGRTGIKSIEIPASVTTIGQKALFACGKLEKIVVAEENEIYDSREGCNAIIEKASNTLIKGCQNTNIPDSVTSIGERAFYSCSGLESIEIPDGVTRIEDGAFGICYDLKSVKIPDSVTYIGYFAFSVCGKLESIEIPAGVTEIESYAFENCSGLKTIVVDSKNEIYDSREGCNAIIEKAENKIIVGCQNTNIPDSVTSISDSAFQGCSGLESIEIPAGITEIGDYTFENCSGLKTIVVDSKNEIYDSRGGCNAIIEKDSNRLIAGCQNTNIPNGVTRIEHGAFRGCSGLKSIKIPASVTEIGDTAFYGCSGLETIVVDSGNEIYDSRGDCNAIIETASSTLFRGGRKTVIPDDVTGIGKDAFSGSGIVSLKIPDSVKSIGKEAFYYCGDLTRIEIPESVTSIGESVFSGCYKVTIYGVPGSSAEEYATMNNIPFKDINGVEEPDPTKLIYGDLTGDGFVKLNDAQLALKIALRIETDPTERQIKAGDVMETGNGINLKDAQAILKRALRIPVIFDVEKK